MKRNNIIKSVAFRESDQRFIEAGGGGDIPGWMQGLDHSLLYENLQNNKKELITQASEHYRIYGDFPIVVEATLHPSAKAKGYRSKVNAFFTNKDINKHIALKDDDKLLYSVNKLDLETIFKKVESIKDDVLLLASIQSIKKYSPKVTNPTNKNKSIKIKLLNFNDDSITRDEEKILLRKLIDKNVKKLFYPNGNIAYELENCIDEVFFNDICGLPFVDSIEGIPEFFYEPNLFSDRETIDGSNINFDSVDEDIFTIKEDSDYPIVGLFDSGIEMNVLSDFCIEHHSAFEDINLNHGTKVGSLICFGDYLNEEKLGIDKCKIISSVARPREDIGEYRILLELEETLLKYSDKAKIWNLSLGSDKAISEDSYSDFASSLDELQKKYNVLFIKSTGNCYDLINSKISCGAESVRALTIGSIAHTCTDLAKTGHISPFSRIGLGPLNLVKPELVYYGGNIGSDGKKFGINTFDENGELVQATGTSFSTPRISALAAHIDKKLPGDFNPLLIKGLLIHKAQYPIIDFNLHTSIKEKYGYGIPSKLDEIFYETDNKITLIFQGEIGKGEFIETLDLPYPKSLIDTNGNYTGKITVTLITDPILSVNQGLEYCQSNVDVSFGTYSNKKNRAGKTIKNEIGPDEAFNLLNNDIFDRKKIHSNEEESLREKGKFAPLKKYTVDLSKLKKGKVKEINENRLWFLRLKPLFKNHIESVTEKSEIKIPYCVLITIESLDETPINQEVIQELNYRGYNPVNLEINIEQEINIK